jgi:hypothetical protein
LSTILFTTPSLEGAVIKARETLISGSSLTSGTGINYISIKIKQ